LVAFEAAPSIAAAEAVEAGAPREGSTLARVAAGLARIGEDAASVRFARLSLREDPNDFRVWRLLATRLARGDDPFAAASAWAETLRRWPREQLGRDDPFDDAFEVLPLGSYWLIALADAPAHWSVRLSRRMLVEERWDLAEAACRQAGTIRPAAHAWMSECAEAIAGSGRADEALAYARSWVAARPGDAWGWLTLADRLAAGESTADLPGQVRALRRAEALRPPGPHVARRVAAAARRAAACADEPACPTRDVAIELRRWAEAMR
jgi:predicted Zn-dependent protease